MKPINRNKIVANLLVCISVSTLVGAICSASSPAQQASITTNSSIARSAVPTRMLKNTQNPEFKSVRLKTPIDLPRLPVYSGKLAFITGTNFPQVKGGPSVTMQYSAMDPPNKVLEWYKDVLSQNKWTLLDNVAGKHGLAAMKGKDICQIITMGPTRPPYKCDLLLRYKFYKPTDF
jgi:hypothetical protein